MVNAVRPSAPLAMERAAARGGEAAHVADQALPHALLIRNRGLTQPECILLAGLALRGRRLGLRRKSEETERKGGESKLQH